MRFEKRILVAIKGSADHQVMVQRVRMIAERLGAEVVLMAASRSQEAQAQQRLQLVLAALQDEGLNVSERPRQRRDLLADLVFAAKELECGLLIKAPDRPRGLSDLLLAPRDWKLLRYAPCPVLIVKQAQSWAGRPVLAALDAAPGDQAHAELNQRILALAGRIAAMVPSPLELVSAHPTPMQASDPLHQSADALAMAYRAQLGALCDAQALQAGALHVDEGPAETLIPQVAKARQAALVVLGTVARRGVSAALMGGNTAEAILSHLPGDVLTLQAEASEDLLVLLDQQQA